MTYRNKPRYPAMRIGNTNATYNNPNDDSAGLQLDDQNVGFLPNRLTTAQRDAINNPGIGLLIFNTDANQLEVYNGSWSSVGGSSSGMTLLSSGECSVVSYIELSMPPQYQYFKLEIVSLQLNGSDIMVYEMSEDGGITYHNNPGDYLMAGYGFSGFSNFNFSFTDQYGALGYQQGTSFSYMLQMMIDPSDDDADTNPSVYSMCSGGDGSAFFQENTRSILNTYSARQNYIRVGPWFTDSVQIQDGYYRFWGIS